MTSEGGKFRGVRRVKISGGAFLCAGWSGPTPAPPHRTAGQSEPNPALLPPSWVGTTSAVFFYGKICTRPSSRRPCGRGNSPRRSDGGATRDGGAAGSAARVTHTVHVPSCGEGRSRVGAVGDLQESLGGEGQV